MNTGLSTDASLPTFLQLSENNPLISQSSPSNYASAYFNQNIAPQLGQDATQSFLGGNNGTSGQSTFGSNFLSNADIQGLNSATLAGQQYYNSAIQNLLNERQSFFGNDVGLAQTQNAAQAQADMTGIGAQNQYNLSAGGSLLNYNTDQQQLQLQADQIAAQENAALASGITGGLFGLGNAAFGGGSDGETTGSTPLSAIGSGLSGASLGGGGQSFMTNGGGLSPFQAGSFGGEGEFLL